MERMDDHDLEKLVEEIDASDLDYRDAMLEDLLDAPYPTLLTQVN